VRRAGELLLRERFDQTGASLRSLSEFAGTGAGSCFANIVFLPPADEASPIWRAELAALHQDGVWVGISRLRSAGWSLRIIAPDPVRLRDVLANVRSILRLTYPRLGCGLRRP
jgi:urease accessory protein UreH